MDKKCETTFSIIIPVLNEEKTLAKVIEAALSANPTEVIIIDDGSTDLSRQIMFEYRNYDQRIKCISHTFNLGVGAARKTGINESSGEILVFIDADISHFENNIVSLLIGPVRDGSFDFILGSFENEGRVTELTVRPLLEIGFPELANLKQPASGQFAAKRKYLFPNKIEPGNQMLGIVLDAHLAGARISEVSIGRLIHSKRPLITKRHQAKSECEAFLKRYLSVEHLRIKNS